MPKISNEGGKASGATYRTATKVIAKALKVKPVHTKSPTEDLMRVANLIDLRSRKRALAFYELGLRRGLRKATDWFADRTIEYQPGKVLAPSILEVSVKIKFSGLAPQPQTFKIKAKDIGFK